MNHWWRSHHRDDDRCREVRFSNGCNGRLVFSHSGVNFSATMLREFIVADIMHETVHTVSLSDSILTAASRMLAEDIGSVIVTENGSPIGIVTDTDLIDYMATNGQVDGIEVETVMSSPLVTIASTASLEDAAALLGEHRISTLAVTSNGSLVGVLGTRDLSYYLPYIIHEGLHSRVAEQRLELPGGAEVAYEREDWRFSFEPADEEDGIGVGDIVRFSKRITEDDIDRFADATGDTNRVHLDASFAEQTRFGEPIAHGLLVAGTISSALARIPGLTIYLAQDLSFHAPVEVGNQVEAECRFTEQLAEDRFRLRTEVRDEDGSCCIDGEAIVLIDDIPAAEE